MRILLVEDENLDVMLPGINGYDIAKTIAATHKGNISVCCFDGFVEFKVQIPSI